MSWWLDGCVDEWRDEIYDWLMDIWMGDLVGRWKDVLMH